MDYIIASNSAEGLKSPRRGEGVAGSDGVIYCEFLANFLNLGGRDKGMALLRVSSLLIREGASEGVFFVGTSGIWKPPKWICLNKLPTEKIVKKMDKYVKKFS